MIEIVPLLVQMEKEEKEARRRRESLGYHPPITDAEVAGVIAFAIVSVIGLVFVLWKVFVQ